MTVLCLVLSLFVPNAVAEKFTLYLTRHYEKQSNINDPSLTKVGVKRSLILRDFLKDKKIRTIYSTDYKRTRETASPVAANYAASVTLYNPTELLAFANRLQNLQHNALIVGHSNTTPALLAYLTGINVTIEETDYGALYAVTFIDSELVHYQKHLIIAMPLRENGID